MNPTPWKAVRHNPVNVTIEDANGVALATAHQFPPYCDSMGTATRIVEAVNNYEALIQERRRLIGELDAAKAHADSELICRGVGERASMRRNCHRFDTLEEATDAWRTENRTWQWADDDTAANYMKARASQDVGEFLDWLFAPAEGGAE